MDERTVALQAWALREAQQSSSLTARTAAVMWTFWRTLKLPRWYVAAQTPSSQTAQLAEQARTIAGDLGGAYMREVINSAGGPPVLAGGVRLPAARNGVDLATVYDRPAEAFRRRYSITEDVDEALRAAEQRLLTMVDLDLQAARRDGEHQVLTAVAGASERRDGSRIIGTRRIIHPELSEGGVCGLCVAASDRIYTLEELRAIHAWCKCTTAVVTEDYDPGESNDVDLEALYAEAGSTAGPDLKRTRWKINEHGELGPVLTREGDRFQEAGQAPKGDPAERAARELTSLEPVLINLERRWAAGEDVAGPLDYQRRRVELLRRVAA